MKVIIAGGGKVGTYLASLLLANDQEVKLVEDNESHYIKASKELPEYVVIKGSPTDPSVLEMAGIIDTDVLAVVTDADEKNLVVSTLGKMEYGVPKVISRVNNPKNAWLYNSEMGVDIAINQADIMAHLILEEIDLENMLTLLKLNKGEYSIVQMSVKQKGGVVNKSMQDFKMPEKSVLISIIRDGSVIIPKSDTQIMQDDEILMLTDDKSTKELQELFG